MVLDNMEHTGYVLSFDIDYDDVRPMTVDTLEVPITRAEYEMIRDLGSPDYYELPASVQSRIREAFMEWGEDRNGGYSIGAIDTWED